MRHLCDTARGIHWKRLQRFVITIPMRKPVKQTLQLPWEGSTATISYLQRPAGTIHLLLLHGLQATSELFLPLFSSRSFSQYTLLAPDFVGFGGSDAPERFSYDLADQASLISQFLTSIKATRVWVSRPTKSTTVRSHVNDDTCRELFV